MKVKFGLYVWTILWHFVQNASPTDCMVQIRVVLHHYFCSSVWMFFLFGFKGTKLTLCCIITDMVVLPVGVRNLLVEGPSGYFMKSCKILYIFLDVINHGLTFWRLHDYSEKNLHGNHSAHQRLVFADVKI